MVKWSFSGSPYFQNTRTNLTSNFVLAVVLVLESKGIYWRYDLLLFFLVLARGVHTTQSDYISVTFLTWNNEEACKSVPSPPIQMIKSILSSSWSPWRNQKSRSFRKKKHCNLHTRVTGRSISQYNSTKSFFTTLFLYYAVKAYWANTIGIALWEPKTF